MMNVGKLSNQQTMTVPDRVGTKSGLVGMRRHWFVFPCLLFALTLWRNIKSLDNFDVMIKPNLSRQVPRVEIEEPSPNDDSLKSSNNEKKQSKRNLSVVLRTWHEDASMALLGLESAVTFIDKHLLEIVILTEQESEEAVRYNLYNPMIEKFPDLYRRNGIRLQTEPNLLRNGHIQQKYSKMTADIHTKGDFILHLDSDCVITKWKEECFLEEDKPVNDFATFESLHDTGVGIWKKGTEVFLGIEQEKYEYSRLNQHVYPRQLYSVLRKRVEDVHGVPFLEVFDKLNVVGTHKDKATFGFNSTLLISDFNLLGATAFHFAPDLMTPKNLTDGITPWRPLCVSQCNAREQVAGCCEKWLAQQMHLAEQGRATKPHASCETDFAPGDPCFCGKQ
jgi:hypothetical protein